MEVMMNMQTYSGHIEAGRFYTKDGVVLPDSKEALLILGTAVKPKNINLEVWKRFFDTINASDEELPETIERLNFAREISI